MKRLKKFREDESGAIMIVIAIGMTVFLSLAALVTDLGLVYYQKSKLQIALDSAALASVRYLPDYNKAQEVAVEYVEKNGFDSSNVVVQFPTADTVRVSKSFESKTIFADIFSSGPVEINNVAAAKFSSKSLSVDFPYRMFQGGPYRMVLSGVFGVEGNIHTNGGILLNGGSCPNGNVSPYGDGRSYVHGLVTGASSNPSDYDTHNNYYDPVTHTTSTVYYNVWSTNCEGVEIGVDKIDMPDYDEEIMAIAPSLPNIYCPDLPAHRYYSYTMTRNDVRQTAVDTYSGNPLFVWYADTTFNGDFGNVWMGFVSFRSLSFRGNVTMGNYCTVLGNVDADKDFTMSYGSTLTIGGYLNASGNISLSANSGVVIGKSLYCGGNLNVNGSTPTTITGDVWVKGNCSLQSTTKITGNLYVDGKLDVNGGSDPRYGLQVGGNIYVKGNGVSSGNVAANLSGYIKTGGDLLVNGKITKGGGAMFETSGDIYAKGDFDLQGGLDMKDGVVYSTGKITTSSGNKISVNGVVIAEHDVYLGGMPIHMNEMPNTTFSIYSRNGNVNFTTGSGDGSAEGTTIYGMIYAPKGTITIGSGNLHFYGNIIGDKLVNSSGGLSLGENNRALPYRKNVLVAALVE